MTLPSGDPHPEQGRVITGPGHGVPGAGPRAAGGRSRLALLAGGSALLLAAAAVLAAFLAARPGTTQQPRVSGIPGDISTSLANLMTLSALPGTPAPAFTLTDQRGRTLSLASLQGKVVVLEFMDPHCTDICPIVSQEFVDAYRDLGRRAGRVVFAAVNVNQYHRSVGAVAAFSTEQGLNRIPDWHFLTGPVAALRAAWRAYAIAVEAPNPRADIVHTSAVYIIDARGRERFLASPEVDHTAKGTAFLPAAEQAAWGRGIAALAIAAGAAGTRAG